MFCQSAEIRFNPTGNISVFTGTHSHGQGHDTTFAQIVSDKLGVPVENIEIVHGDTDKGPFGMGTYGSRSLAVGGSAISKACDKIVEKGNSSDLFQEIRSGHFRTTPFQETEKTYTFGPRRSRKLKKRTLWDRALPGHSRN